MMNYWFASRPMRSLISVPNRLSLLCEFAYNKVWSGARQIQLEYEQALEEAGIKREGDRRDQRAGGARTQEAVLSELGLIFKQNKTNRMQLTLAGQAILDGEPPVPILRNQILKLQFPSAYSQRRNVNVNPRFKIRPFRFLLQLLTDSRLGYLTEEEIGKIVITEADSENQRCYEHIVQRILAFREDGDSVLEKDFLEKYPSDRMKHNVNFGYESVYSSFKDIANTFTNRLRYAQLIERQRGGIVTVIEDQRAWVESALSTNLPFIPQPENEEVFQRRYGLDLSHNRDTRNLSNEEGSLAGAVRDSRVRTAFLEISTKRPVVQITTEIIEAVAQCSGISSVNTEETLQRLFPHSAIGTFMAGYHEMAYQGTKMAIDFEIATKEVFKEVFKFDARHVGPVGLSPDVLVLSDSNGYQAIIDTKAYSKYSISNDHSNRMVHNYIGNLHKYSNSSLPMAFFTYIAGGFGPNIASQLNNITAQTRVPGSAMPIANMIEMIRKNQESPYSHSSIREVFSVDRQILLSDL